MGEGGGGAQNTRSDFQHSQLFRNKVNNATNDNPGRVFTSLFTCLKIFHGNKIWILLPFYEPKVLVYARNVPIRIQF